MTEDTIRPPDPEPAPPGGAGEAGGPGGTPSGADPAREWEPEGASGSSQGREWLAQLQGMIDRIAAEAAPVARDVAAKAAELAAVAGEKAGPLARRAAEVTGDVGVRVAERSRRFADEMRHRAPDDGASPAEAAADAPSTDVPPGGSSTDAPGGPSDTDGQPA